MRFNDFYIGQVIEAGPYTLIEPELNAFAQRYDPQWFHTDTSAAQGGPYGGIIASGWQTCAIAMRLSVDSIYKNSNAIGSPGVSYLKWPAAVRAGDILRLKTTVLETRFSKQRADRGILRTHWELKNQNDIAVLNLEAISFFDLTR